MTRYSETTFDERFEPNIMVRDARLTSEQFFKKVERSIVILVVSSSLSLIFCIASVFNLHSNASSAKTEKPAVQTAIVTPAVPLTPNVACVLTETPTPTPMPTATATPTGAATIVETPEETEESSVETTQEEEEPADETPALPTAERLFDAEIALIPANHLAYLEANGWTWCVTSMDLAAEFGYDVSIVGLTYYPDKVIYIANRPERIRRATIHEFGHALAYQLGDVDETDEFYDIFYAERDNFHDCTSIGDGHEIMNTDEYFASVYQNMILNYDETYADVPRTVEYIERVLSVI